MPGSNARALEKGRSLPADGLILDLEDAVAPDAKRDGAAGDRRRAARRGGYGWRELIVRVNGLDTPWGYADLVAMAHAGADAHPAAQGRERRHGAPGASTCSTSPVRRPTSRSGA